MPTEVCKLPRAARDIGSGPAGGVRRNARNLHASQRFVGPLGEPAGMSRLARHHAAAQAHNSLKEGPDHGWTEFETWRELH